MALSAGLPCTNKLLLALPASDRERISGNLTTAPISVRDVIYKQDSIIRDVYFPGGGAWSMKKTMEDGQPPRGTIGNEGMTGSAVFFGDQVSHTEMLVQIAQDDRPLQDVRGCVHRGNESARRLS